MSNIFVLLEIRSGLLSNEENVIAASFDKMKLESIRQSMLKERNKPEMPYEVWDRLYNRLSNYIEKHDIEDEIYEHNPSELIYKYITKKHSLSSLKKAEDIYMSEDNKYELNIIETQFIE